MHAANIYCVARVDATTRKLVNSVSNIVVWLNKHAEGPRFILLYFDWVLDDFTQSHHSYFTGAAAEINITARDSPICNINTTKQDTA